MKIVLISGSSRKNSLSHHIAMYLQDYFKNKNLQIDVINMQTTVLPFIQKVWTKREDVPAEFVEQWDLMQDANAFILVSPEYNGGYSPAMKNFLDHFPKFIFAHKALGIVTGSTGAMGGMRAAQQLFLLAAGFGAIASPTMLITGEMDKKFSPEGKLIHADFQKSIDKFSEEFLWLSERLMK